MRRPSRRDVISAAAVAAPLGGLRAAPIGGILPVPLRRGISCWPWFSLTREFPAPRTDYDWPPFQIGRPVPRADDLERLAAAGFDFIRIPVDPGPFLATVGEQHAALLEMLRSAVAAGLAAGLKVIVNIQANDATHYWNSALMVSSVAAPAFPLYLRLVQQTAKILASFPQDQVVLEPINEPPQACGASTWPPVQQALLARARAVAPNLTLIATGACGSLISGLQALDPAVGVGGPMLYTFHFYEPYLFSHQGAPWMTGEPVYRDLNAVPWPAARGTLAQTLEAVRLRMGQDTQRSEAEKHAAYLETKRVLRVYFDAQPARPFIEGYLVQVQAWLQRYGIPADRILMGEFGALRSDARYVASGAADRARYIRDVRKATEACGFAWAFWNLFDGFSIFVDDTTRVFDLPIVEALGLTAP